MPSTIGKPSPPRSTRGSGKPGWRRTGRRSTPTMSSSRGMACSARACGAFDAPVYRLPEQESPDFFHPFLLDVQNDLLSDLEPRVVIHSLQSRGHLLCGVEYPCEELPHH